MVKLSPQTVGIKPAKPTFRGISHELTPATASSGMVVQAKMTIRPPGDKYEQEADRIAAQVVNQIHAPAVQQQAENESVQRQPASVQPLASDGGMSASPELETSIRQARNGGQSLPTNIREPMEQALGADFSGVRVHADAQSDALNRSIQAEAFTTGQDMFFRHGAYAPGNPSGQALIAHELTHVVQQRRDISRPIQRKVTPQDDFPGRSKTEYGIGEQMTLSLDDVDESTLKKYPGKKLEWKQTKGKGTLLDTNDTGQANYVADSEAEDVILECKPELGEEHSETVLTEKFQVIEPNAGKVQQLEGTNIWHKADAWHVAFVANLFVLPQNVSFSAIKFQEGQAPPQITGHWQAPTGDHQMGGEETMFPPGQPHADTVNQVKTTDWIQSGTYSMSDRLENTESGTFKWEIPWIYILGSTRKVFATIEHIAEDNGKGLARIKKDGSPWFEAKADDSGIWPYNEDQDIRDIKKSFPDPEMTPDQEKDLRADQYLRTDIILAEREGHYPLNAGLLDLTLVKALKIEKYIAKRGIWSIQGIDLETVGKIRKMSDPQRKALKRILVAEMELAQLKNLIARVTTPPVITVPETAPETAPPVTTVPVGESESIAAAISKKAQEIAEKAQEIAAEAEKIPGAIAEKAQEISAEMSKFFSSLF
ncbi:DUF4157 domain-containing protein [Calothrix sp. FACHB-156]|nr:DUF4157 domain-containing protein [Calothrix sp. FACHB-156]